MDKKGHSDEVALRNRYTHSVVEMHVRILTPVTFHLKENVTYIYMLFLQSDSLSFIMN